jgi:hypothetical protein
VPRRRLTEPGRASPRDYIVGRPQKYGGDVGLATMFVGHDAEALDKALPLCAGNACHESRRPDRGGSFTAALPLRSAA